MTKALHQSISLLQLSNLELDSWLDHSIEENVFLEKKEKDTQEDEATLYSSSHLYNNNNNMYERDYSNEEALHTQPLHSYLREKIHIHTRGNSFQREIAYKIIDLVQDNGYLIEDPAEIAEKFAVNVEEVNVWILKIQACEPTGVGARNLEECLRLQLQEKNKLDGVMDRLLTHLPLIAQKHYEKLQKLCGISNERLKEKIALIKTLNPHPGNMFLAKANNPMILRPDLLMQMTKENQWEVILNSAAFPSISLKTDYFKKIETEPLSGQEKTFLEQQWQSASWIAKSVNQRKNTILRVAREIIAHQEVFFRENIEAIKPLKRSDIAEKLGIHESTVSRVTTGKYIQTPRGCFELKYFFATSLKHIDPLADVVSNKSLQNMIRHLIKQEKLEHIFSDYALASHITKNFIPISRRTVTKYRKLLGIPSSVIRKREMHIHTKKCCFF